MDTELLQSTLEQIDAVVVVADESGHVRWVSPGAESLLGVADADTVSELLGAAVPTGAELPEPGETDRRRISLIDRELEVSVETVEDSEASAVYVCREARDLRTRYHRERSLLDHLIETSSAAIFVLAPDGRITRMNDRGEEILQLSREEVIGNTCPALDVQLRLGDGTPVPGDEWPATRAVTDGEPTATEAVELVRADGTGRRISIDAAPVAGPDGDVDRVVVSMEDISERTATERTLARQRDELRRLNRINKLIRDVNRAIVGETTRQGINETVCRCLIEADIYAVAAVIEVPADGEPRIATAAGIDEEYLATLTDIGDDDIERAIRETSRENVATFVTDFDDATKHPAVVRRTAASLGVEWIGNFPLSHDETVEGVLTLGTRDAEGFVGREQTVLVELGQIIGRALEALQTKKLLHGEVVIELEFATGADACLVRASETAGTTCRLEGVVPVEENQYLSYVSLEEAGVATVEGTTADHPAVENVRTVEEGAGVLLELRIAETDPVAVLVDEGGLIQSGTFTDGNGRVVVTLPLSTAVRDFVDRVTRRAPGLELLAKREVEQSVPVGRTAWRELDEILTDRQRTVLEAAYLAGYFDWPRRSTTGEELAASLGLASSTLHQHLRVAERKVFDYYFEDAR